MSRWLIWTCSVVVGSMTGCDREMDGRGSGDAIDDRDDAAMAEPLTVADVYGALREGTVDRTQYFCAQSSDTWNNCKGTYLLGPNGSTYDYPESTAQGHLMIGHTFDAIAPDPMRIRLNYKNLENTAMRVDAYLPDFTTTGGSKMLFYVGEDGSTYYADPEHDGYRFANEVLTPEQALVPDHLARCAPWANRLLETTAPLPPPDGPFGVYALFGFDVRIAGGLLAVTRWDWFPDVIWVELFDRDTLEHVGTVEPSSDLGLADNATPMGLAFDGTTLAVAVWGTTLGTLVYEQGTAGWELQQVIQGKAGPLALQGDTLLIGQAQLDAANSTVDVYERGSNGFALTQKLRPDDWPNMNYALFGYSLAIDGDRIAIGARQDNPLGPSIAHAGSAYVFVRTSSGWAQEAKLIAPGAGELDMMGESIAISGDRVLVGSDAGYQGKGRAAARVFTRSGTTWTYTTELLPANPQEMIHGYGKDVALEGDLAIVGSYATEGYTGALFVYEANADGTWTHQSKLVTPRVAYNAWYGEIFATDGEVIIGGSPGYLDPGAAQIFSPNPVCDAE